jgi:hypothetical protein
MLQQGQHCCRSCSDCVCICGGWWKAGFVMPCVCCDGWLGVLHGCEAVRQGAQAVGGWWVAGRAAEDAMHCGASRVQHHCDLCAKLGWFQLVLICSSHWPYAQQQNARPLFDLVTSSGVTTDCLAGLCRPADARCPSGACNRAFPKLCFKAQSEWLCSSSSSSAWPAGWPIRSAAAAAHQQQGCWQQFRHEAEHCYCCCC